MPTTKHERRPNKYKQDGFPQIYPGVGGMIGDKQVANGDVREKSIDVVDVTQNNSDK